MSLLRIVPYIYVPIKKRFKQNLHYNKSVDPDTRVHGLVNQNDLWISIEVYDQEENSVLGICISGLRDRNASQIKKIYMQPQEKENDNYDLDPFVDGFKPTSTGLNHFVEVPITSRLVEANGIDGREVKAFPQPMTFTTDFATEKDLSSMPLSDKVDTFVIGGCNILKCKAETRGQEVLFLSSNDNTVGKSDESDSETVFGERPSKWPRSRSSMCSLESSVNLNIADVTLAKPFVCHDINYESSLFDFTCDDGSCLASVNGDEPLKSDWNVSEIADIRYDEENEAEFCDSPVWYRFGPNIKSTSQSSHYVAQISDINCEREFHNIIGKEDIDGEVYYLVDWASTLVRGEILREAKAQLLIDRFETRCQYQEATLGMGYKAPQKQDCNKNRPKKRKHKEIVMKGTWEDNKDHYTQDRWRIKRWQQRNISGTSHSNDSTSNSSDQDDEFRPAKQRKISLTPTNHGLTLSQHNIKHRLQQYHTLEIDMVQPQGYDRHLPTPIENHHHYPPVISTPSGINFKNVKSADISTPRNAAVHSRVQKAKPLSACSVVIYSKVPPAVRTKRNSVRWTPSENKTVLKMKKSGCLWEEIHNALPHRTLEAIQVHYSTKLKN